MVFSGEDKEHIIIYLLKGYRPMKLITEFPSKNWKRNGLELCETGLTDQ